MKNEIAKYVYFVLMIIIVISLTLYPTQVKAYENIDVSTLTEEKDPGEIIGFLGDTPQTRITSSDVVYHIMNKSFFIKNAYSGQYLDVYNGNTTSYTNVQQWPYNGGSNQRWYINYNGDGTFTFYSEVGNNMVLDINEYDPNNGANVQIFESNGSIAQKFKIGYTSSSTYVIVTQASNFTKAISTANSVCTAGENVHQYDYAGLWSERWILDPVEKDVELGALYATDNYNTYVQAYPNLSNNGGDCTNFVSQCMLASGIHYNGNWNILRKNGNYTDITSNAQLNDSWSVSDPSPWISAEEFKNFWVGRVSGAYKGTGQQIIDNPSLIWNLPITQGCVVQRADKFLGDVGKATHSMYITGYLNNNTYLLTYHSNNTLSKSLLEFCEQDPNSYYLFYVF